MTRKEAIGNLNMIRVAFIDTVTVEQGKIIDDTFRAAIEALKAEPCEDCISREVILDYVNSHIQEINTGYGDLNQHTNRVLSMIVDYIEKIPSVNPVNTGHWKQISPAKIYECSVCGQNVMTNDIVCYKYCHGCGAKMEGSDADSQT